jgi:hypothetical protein
MNPPPAHQKAKFKPLGRSRAHRFNVGRAAMEKLHEGGFDKICNRNLDRCMCSAAVVQLV